MEMLITTFQNLVPLQYMILLLSFIIGTALGSFSLVISSRTYNKEKGILFGRSHCLHCKTNLKFYNLIPLLSYIFQRGKCSSCFKPIGIKYFLVELFYGLIFTFTTLVLFSLQIGSLPILLIYGTILFFILLSSLHDLLYKEVEDKFIMPFLIFIGLILLYQDFFQTIIITPITNFFSGQYLLVETSDILKNVTSYQGDIGIYIVEALSAIVLFLLYRSIFSDKRHFIYITIASIISVILYFTLPVTFFSLGTIASNIFFIFFYFLILLTRGKGLGGGDLRFALVLGLLYGPIIFWGISFSYFISIVFIIILFLFSLLRITRFKRELPFGPLLFFTYYLFGFNLYLVILSMFLTK